MLRRCTSGNFKNLIKVLTLSLTWRCFCAQFLLMVASPMAWSQSPPVMCRREEMREKDGVRT